VNTVHEPVGLRAGLFRRRIWLWVALGVLVVAGTSLVGLQILMARAGPLLKDRVVQVLSTHLDSRVEIDRFNVSVMHGLQVSGDGLRIFSNNPAIASDTHALLIGISHFDFHSQLLGLIWKPMHVGTVHVRGLAIIIPPKRDRGSKISISKDIRKSRFELDNVVCDDSSLTIESSKPGKDPLLFQLKHIVLHHVGSDAPWPYEAILTNAMPPGEIQTSGTFGPWETESPGDSNVTGKYRFDHADLDAIHGIGGLLHSIGSFDGQLDRIDVEGTVEVPNFSLDTANHALPLSTRYRATVDGTTGDTYLHSVDAKLADSRFRCTGAIVNVKGKGHIIDLDVDVPAGRIQDFLALAVRTEPTVMQGVIQTKAKLHLRPGKERVAEKLRMEGSFVLQEIHFTNPAIEDKVDRMSLRAQGDPQEAKPGAADVHSTMSGQFAMRNGRMHFADLDYDLPGAKVTLDGLYSLDGRHFDFSGKVRTKAALSNMVASKWKKVLLLPVDPFFRKNGAGAEIPVKITGTGDKPHFGLNLGGR
jgi:hypothetical protein